MSSESEDELEASQQEPVDSDSTGSSTHAVVPQNGYMFDPDAEIIDETLPSHIEPLPDIDLPHYTSPHFGKCVQLQKADDNLQGYYLFAQNGKFGGYTGPVLIKYFNILGSELSRQAREFYTVNEVSQHAIANTHAAELKKNKKRELHFMTHPNIVKIVAYISPGGRSENINAIVMEGASEGPIYVFENGSNVKLGNFGFARKSKDGPLTANKGEEIYYKAPEIIYGEPVTDYGFSVDVYSYGMVVWTICHNGKKPFQDIAPNILRSANKFRTYLEENINGNPNANRPPIALNPHDPESKPLINIIEACWINEVGLADKRPSMGSIVSYLKQKFPLLANC